MFSKQIHINFLSRIWIWYLHGNCIVVYEDSLRKHAYFKYTENFTSKYWKFSDKNNDIFHVFTKTYLYNFDPLKPHFYIAKLGFTGVYIILLFLLKNIDCGYSLEPPRRGGSNEYPQSMFWAEIWKISAFLSENFKFFGGEIFYIYLNRRVFVMFLLKT